MAVAKRTGAWVFEILRDTPESAKWSDVQWIATLTMRETALKLSKKIANDNKATKAVLTPLEKERKKEADALVRAQKKIMAHQAMTEAQKDEEAMKKVQKAQEKEDALTPEQRAARDKKKEEAKSKADLIRKEKQAAKKAEKEAAKKASDEAAMKASEESVEEPA